MQIQALLNEGMIMPELSSRERDSVLKEMVEFLASKDKIRKGSDLFEKLIQRERLGSTAIGDGIAIPHCKSKEAESPLLVLAVSKRGVQFEAVDGKLTHIFFLAVSSPDDPGQNLQILGSIAHLARRAGSLPKRLMAAKNPRKILAIIREEEEKLEG